MSERTITLATFSNALHAEAVRYVLVSGGIRALVVGSELADVFSGMGVGLSHVEVLISEADFDAAVALLLDLDEEDVPHEASTAIREAIMVRHAPMTDIREPRTTPLQSTPPEPETDEPWRQSNESPDDCDADLRQLPESEEGEEAEAPPPGIVVTADMLARKSLVTTFFGWVFCPLAFYSLWIVVQVFAARDDLSTRGKLNVLAALLFNPVVWVILAFFIARLFNGPTIALLQ